MCNHGGARGLKYNGTMGVWRLAHEIYIKSCNTTHDGFVVTMCGIKPLNWIHVSVYDMCDSCHIVFFKSVYKSGQYMGIEMWNLELINICKTRSKIMWEWRWLLVERRATSTDTISMAITDRGWDRLQSYWGAWANPYKPVHMTLDDFLT